VPAPPSPSSIPLLFVAFLISDLQRESPTPASSWFRVRERRRRCRRRGGTQTGRTAPARSITLSWATYPTAPTRAPSKTPSPPTAPSTPMWVCLFLTDGHRVQWLITWSRASYFFLSWMNVHVFGRRFLVLDVALSWLRWSLSRHVFWICVPLSPTLIFNLFIRCAHLQLFPLLLHLLNTY
jgi:hypothetical protein